METPRRKLEHIDVVMNERVEGFADTLLGDVILAHKALPETDLNTVSLTTTFLGKRISAPIMITGMTGGHPNTAEINAGLAMVAENMGIALGVGSQRAAIEDPKLSYTYRVARENAPTIPLIANLGAVQLNKGYWIREAERAVEMLEADALALHLNAAQEAFQPEGDTEFRGLTSKICKLADMLQVPVIVKETGAGLSREDVESLWNCGIRYFDVSGAGGTSWIAVEMYRARRKNNILYSKTAESFLEWGIPTAASIIEARLAAPSATIIGSGGIRRGIDAAKAIALGADIAGLALPALRRLLMGGEKALKDYLGEIIHGLKVAVFLAGCGSPTCLRQTSRIIVKGNLKDWLEARGISWSHYLKVKQQKI